MKNLVIIILIFFSPAVFAGDRVRPPAHAGQFYPAEAGELKSIIERYLGGAKVNPPAGTIRGLWLPHAGYIFSGRIAANGYNLVRGKDFDLVVIIGPSHYASLSGASIGDYTRYRTPLGDAEVDTIVAGKLLKNKLFDTHPSAHILEHCLEVQIPFIQTVLPDVPVLPVLVGQLTHSVSKKIASALVNAVKGRNVLIIASSDMSHFPSYKTAYEVDQRVLAVIGKYDTKRLLKINREILQEGHPGLECAMCGAPALSTVMLAAEMLGSDEAQLLPYANSGDVLGDRNRVVGYGAAVFYEPAQSTGVTMSDDIKFTDAEIDKLFNIARTSILNGLRGTSPAPIEVTEANLQKKRGVFVTLTNDGDLRGCIGFFDADYPLHLIVAKMARAAATEDYRFAHNPVTESEMEEINIKISILSERRKIDSIEEVEVGKHGIWITLNGRGGTYLPEVAVEQGWDKYTFVEHCMVNKAGLPKNALELGAELYVYSSQIIDEKE